ncbi:tRNA pseudouridine(13) synthase TruD [Rhodanobacter sp. FW510-R12]|uniref:tRNA pseudouridine(13) synthase TruD n=1 Tax=unclassified Rhodanobacter TaxID=2621553 RepID=UPI0007AA25E0|nr:MULTISPECIES: tRNA pseudouridine(13) synthase TruD [unclassified Rhodanobacter]KZC17333.1 tRNA pseudouridine(13) synthase TruD [Rhodanobacter sp. FW104-R8]KZC26391.1 tRNA pseudouridine(13) synthase TruD [Rhodanobacter sp. FW510-T8]KZC33696.1 tRNA pseudouridine(13) synthase TruD [Rhodanobacter sp. FW510-R10]
MQELPYAFGEPPLTARLRASPEDFQVEEILGYDADGAGEHALLWVEKRGANTDWVARELAKFAGVPQVAVGYAGMKDRHAVTRQAFSVQLAGKPDPDWSAFPRAEVKVLAATRHSRKLKRGALRGNRFVLVLREVQGDRTAAERVLEQIAARGVPNYFGEQRFGREGGNVAQARAMFGGRRVDRDKRSFLLSAARSQIFNGVLAARVKRGAWDSPLDGEIWSLAGSRSWFGPEPFDATLAERLARGDIHPSGPLWGQGEPPSQGEAGALEREIGAANSDLADGLAAARMEQERRPLRLLPKDLRWHWLGDDALELSFELPAGAYATVVVRELASSTAT